MTATTRDRAHFEALARKKGHADFYRYRRDGLNNGRAGQYRDAALELAWKILSVLSGVPAST